MTSTNSRSHDGDASSHQSDRKQIPFFFLFMCTTCMCAIYSNSIVYHSTINFLHAFHNTSNDDFYEEVDVRMNQSTLTAYHVVTRQVYYLSGPQKESLITVTPVGTVIAGAPIAYAYNHMGFRRSFVLCGVMSVIPAIFFPVCVNAKTYLLAIVLRIFQGCSLAVFIPYVCKLSVFLSFDHIAIPALTFGFIHVSELVTTPVATMFASTSLGWHAPHTAGNILVVVLFIFFCLVHIDDDFRYRASTIGVCNAMFEYERARSRTFDLRIPYLSIYQDFRIWVIFFTSFAYGCALQLFLQFGPTFLHKVVGHDEMSASLVAMLAPLGHLAVSASTLWLHSRLANTETNKMRFFNSASFGFCGICLFAMGWLDPARHKAFITLLFVLASSALGASYAGHFRMNQLRSGHHHVFLLVNLFFVHCAAMFMSSLLNVLIAKNTDYVSWWVLFLVHAVLLVVAGIVFFAFCSSDDADWAKAGYEDSSIQPARGEPMPQFPL